MKSPKSSSYVFANDKIVISPAASDVSWAQITFLGKNKVIIHVLVWLGVAQWSKLSFTW